MKWSTPEQVNDFRKKGLCFKCDEKFLPGQKCSVRKLMMIEIDYPADEGEILFEPKEKKEEIGAEISMHAMEGNVSSQTVRLMGYNHNKHVSILLDTGSTYNFVDPKIVQRTGLNLTPELYFKVTVVGDDKLHSVERCKSVHIKCQGKHIITDFHVLLVRWYSKWTG